MITEDYVSFETAKLLKEKGFDEPCNKCWYIETKDIEDVYNGKNSDLASEFISAPTLQMTMKWLREKFNVLIVIDRGENFYAWQLENNTTGKYIGEIVGECPSYEQAAEAAIKYCLENLI